MTVTLTKTQMRLVVRAAIRAVDCYRSDGFSNDRIESLVLDKVWNTLLTTPRIGATINHDRDTIKQNPKG